VFIIGPDRGPATGRAFDPAEPTDPPDITPTSHNAAPRTIKAMPTAGLPPPKRLKIRNCMPNAGRMSDAPPITTSTAPHCSSFLFIAYRESGFAVHMDWASQGAQHLRRRESLPKNAVSSQACLRGFRQQPLAQSFLLQALFCLRQINRKAKSVLRHT
jgi:hypothetical protein